MEYPKFKVCCRCFTFNQAKYITDAMNGFTMQQTSFPFVCCIVDDASTDGEQEVIRKYVEENFDFSEGSVAYHKETDYAHITYAQYKTNKNCYFAVLYLKENHYSQKKSKMPYLDEWRGLCEYEAICEGDDYWIVPDKLQKQVDYLESHPKIGLVYTQSDIILQNSKTIKKQLCSSFDDLEDLFIANPIATLTIMFKSKLYEQYIQEVQPSKRGWLMGDYPMYLWFEINSKIGFIPNTTAIYRVLSESASHSQNLNKMLAFVECHFDIQRYFISKYNLSEHFVILGRKYLYLKKSTYYFQHKKTLDGIKCGIKAKRMSPKDYMKFIKNLLLSLI